ncbi:MAG: S28 family serine protease [Kofleriaceae bacterium]
MLGAVVFGSLIGGCATEPETPAYPFPDGESPVGKGDTITALPVQMNAPTAGSFTQQIDHDSQQGTFNQRFWYSTEFTKGDPNAPVLFYFCGEAACDPGYALTMADAAYSLNAAVVVLEHRYYGESKPYPDYTLDHMKYLTIHNALEDGAAFETYAKTNLPLAGKWIAVGGSYPGMLAAFYRETHPELVVGAWASSAPVQVTQAFSGYDMIASKALGQPCLQLFQQVLKEAGTAYDDPTQKDQLSMALFGAPAPATKTDFLSYFSNYAEGAAQYGNERKLCAALEQESDPMTGFQEYLYPPIAGVDPSVPNGPTAEPGTHANPAPSRGKIISKLVAPDVLGDFTGNEWFYQVCTEVGFFQIKNSDRTQSIMADGITTQYWTDLCNQYVGKQPAIDATRTAFVDKLDQGMVSNVLFVNGSNDPWSSLSYTDSAAPAGLSTLVVATGSHCEDLESLTLDSVLGVFKAHKEFYDLATTVWLK